jgi:hypothetical protein
MDTCVRSEESSGLGQNCMVWTASAVLIADMDLWLTIFSRPEDIFGSLEVDGQGHFVDQNGNYQPSGEPAKLPDPNAEA